MKKKIFTVVLIAILVISTMSVVVSASSLIPESKANPKEVKAGEEVTVTLSLTNIDKGDKDGVNGITGKISYNPSVLTYVNNSITGLNGWTVYGFDDTTLTFAISNGNQYVTSNQDVVSFKFKVNSNATVTSTDVEITGMEASFGTILDVTNADTVSVASSTATINITKEADVTPTVDPTPTPQADEPTTGTTTPTITTNVLNANSSNDKTLPQTGISDFILPAILVLGAISIISYIRYKKYKNI